MYHSHFHSDMAKVNQYKKYSNKLNKIELDSKNRYFNKEFETCKHNLKATWKLIGELHQCPTRIMRNSKIFTTKYDISNQFKYISWDQQINHVKNKISKNTGIINKVRNYLDIKMLKQLYYALVYPYIN